MLEALQELLTADFEMVVTAQFLSFGAFRAEKATDFGPSFC